MKSEKLGDAVRSSIQSIERDAFIKTVRERPKTTLGEVLALAEEMGFKDLTLGDIMEAGVTQRVNGRAVGEKIVQQKGKGGGKKKAPPKAGTSGASKVITTRTIVGRQHLDNRVLSEMRCEVGREWPASALTELIKGASAHQIRQSLARLIEDDRVTWGGRARGTWYMVEN